MAGAKPGPARKPALKVVREGNPGKRPVPQVAQPQPGRPDEPDWAYQVPDGEDPARSERVRTRAGYWWKLWADTLDPMGLLSPAFGMTLQEAALVAAKLEETERQIELVGYTEEGQRGMVPNRLFTRANQLQQAYYRLIPQLGLAPASLIEAKDDAKAPDPDADI